MKNNQSEKFKWQLLELSDGITTSEGNWYHITRKGIETYIPGLLKKYTLERIIKDADAWLKTPDVLSLILYFILTLLGVDPILSAAVSLLYFFLWFMNISTFVLPILNPFVRIIHNDGFIYLISALVLIYFSNTDMQALWIGVFLLFLFKVGLLHMLLKYILSRISAKTPQADRVLNMLLIRLGMKEGLLSKNVQDMEQELLRLVNFRKKGNK